jgi:hypothetical protein
VNVGDRDFTIMTIDELEVWQVAPI